MKTSKGLRTTDHADELRKAKRLEPMHKSGKVKHTLYNRLGEEEDDEALPTLHRRESVLDYLDDEE
ncbi:MAG: hypothetical protein ACLSVO_05240 [Alistipes sp.]|jgi:hypothetical protein|uniref:hypothetical protein n=1 Tax=Alistipes sp. TaxID=1872444 RepID=UPI0011C8D526|nr:hypothetical protein [Alistipes sp.]MBS6100883.1 hypothetical protein [Alistipes sp.]HJI19655.1 hypothetical protein [Rikenellaceae bacterium]